MADTTTKEIRIEIDFAAIYAQFMRETNLQADRIPHDKVMRSIELFGERIIPRFR